MANMFMKNIIIFSQGPGVPKNALMGFAYQPGYKAQKMKPRPHIIKQLKDKQQHVLMHLNHPPSHYSAFVPTIQYTESSPGRNPPNASREIVICDSD